MFHLSTQFLVLLPTILECQYVKVTAGYKQQSHIQTIWILNQPSFLTEMIKLLKTAIMAIGLEWNICKLYSKTYI